MSDEERTPPPEVKTETQETVNVKVRLAPLLAPCLARCFLYDLTIG
jgi:hypothetical protein